MPRHSFLLPDRRDFAGRLVATFLWLSLVALLIWAMAALYEETHPPDYRNGLQYQPIWH